MLKKVLIISSIVIVVLGSVGYFGVEYLFSKFIFAPSIASIEQEQKAIQTPQGTPQPGSNTSAEQANLESVNSEKGTAQTDKQTNPTDNSKTGNKAVDSITEVSKSPSLTKKLESEIFVTDKAKAMGIVLSAFSQGEVQRFYAMAADGISSAERQEMLSVARKRFSSQQKRELMDIYMKYMDKVSKLDGER